MKKTRNYLKMAIMLGVALLFVLILSNSVSAFYTTGAITSGTPNANSLDDIPSAMTFDLKTTKLDEIEEAIYRKVVNTLKAQNMTIEDGVYNSKTDVQVNYIECNGSEPYTFNLDKCTVKIGDRTTGEYKEVASKEIAITLTNKGTYNETDKQYIDNLTKKIPEILYHDIDLDLTFGKFPVPKGLEVLLPEYIDTSKVEIIYTGLGYGSGGPEPLGSSGGGTFFLFKDGIYYKDVHFKDKARVVVNVPLNIEDTENARIEYATKKLQEHVNKCFEDFEVLVEQKITKIEKESNNIYKVFFNNKDESRYTVIIKKAEKQNISNADTTTKVKLETDTSIVPADTKLVVQPINKGNTYTIVEKALKEIASKMQIYDISLQSNNAKIQPNGKVKISIPIPSNFDKSRIVVYRIAENGTKTEYKSEVKNGYATFETDHFSTYVLAEKKATPTKPATTPTTPTNNEKDETPKTGATDIIMYVVATTIFASIGLIALKKYSK